MKRHDLKLPPIKNRPPKKPNSLLYLLILALIFTAVYYMFSPSPLSDSSKKNSKIVPISEVIRKYKKGEVEKIQVKDNQLFITLNNKDSLTSYKLGNETLSDLGLNDATKKTKIEILNTELTAFWANILTSIIPFVLIIGFLVFMMRAVSRSSSSAMSFGKSRDKLIDKSKMATKFSDVAGAKEAKEELVEIVDFLKHPEKYLKIGAKIPRGVILIGAPGTGKTLLARAVAGEASVPFFSISGSEFVEMFVGVGASRVRDLFQKAKRNSPCIIFIDEIDAVGRQRGGAGFSGGHDEREQTLNQILTEMDGFDKNTNVIVMAATNRPDVLDTALLRPGRFDRRIIIDMPNINDREEIIKVHSRNKPMEKNVDFKRIARQTPGFSGADLENLINEAAILSAKKDKQKVGQNELESSIEKVMIGPERKSRMLSKKEKKITAFHEVGHAIVAYLLPNCDPVHKISIISRGMTLGITWMLPEEDVHLMSESKFKDDLASLLGGHTAEKIIFKEVTTGSSNDLQRAAEIARKMVTEYGMSSELGPVLWGEKTPSLFLGQEFSKSKNYSEEIAAKIDKEVKNIICEALARTENLLADNKTKLREIATVLLKKETLTKEEFEAFFKERKKRPSRTSRKNKKKTAKTKKI